MRELEHLVAAIFDDGDTFSRQCVRVDDWQRLFDRAFAHGVAGLLCHHLDVAGVAVPVAAREQAEQLLAVDRLWYRRTLAELERIYEVFEQRGVRAVALKGVLLGERVYPRPMLRPAGDLDLLIDAPDRPAARDALGAAGYSPRAWRPHETPPDHAAVFERPGGWSVDLHRLASDGFGTTLADGALIERSIRYRTAGGARARILCPEDELLYLAVHVARHRFTRLGWLVDLKLWIDRHPDLRWHVAGDRARSWQVLRAVAVTRAMLEKSLRRLELPASARAVLATDLRARAAVLLTSAADHSTRLDPAHAGVAARSCRVLWGHTFHALLGEGILAGFAYWIRSVTRSARKLGRRLQ